MNKLFGYVGVLVIAVTIIGSSFLYIKNLNESITNLTSDLKTSEAELLTQKAIVEDMELNIAKQEYNLKTLNINKLKAERESRELQEKLAKHDLLELARAKPILVQKRMNDSIDALLREIEEISSGNSENGL